MMWIVDMYNYKKKLLLSQSTKLLFNTRHNNKGLISYWASNSHNLFALVANQYATHHLAC